MLCGQNPVKSSENYVRTECGGLEEWQLVLYWVDSKLKPLYVLELCFSLVMFGLHTVFTVL